MNERRLRIGRVVVAGGVLAYSAVFPLVGLALEVARGHHGVVEGGTTVVSLPYLTVIVLWALGLAAALVMSLLMVTGVQTFPRYVVLRRVAIVVTFISLVSSTVSCLLVAGADSDPSSVAVGVLYIATIFILRKDLLPKW